MNTSPTERHPLDDEDIDDFEPWDVEDDIPQRDEEDED
jgi:hypothetical protein